MVMVALVLFPRTVPINLPHNSHILILSTLLFMSQILVYAECTLAGRCTLKTKEFPYMHGTTISGSPNNLYYSSTS